MIKFACLAAAAALSLIATPAAAEPGKAIIAIYHVAPGQQANFLKWMDQQDRISTAAGIAKGQLYAHTDGDSWDYLVINPVTSEAQDAAFDAAGRKMGVNTMRGGLELRKYISSHTDTFVRGPMTTAEYLSMVGEK
ncbi:MAG: hypothetical protein H0W65_07235 [Sphingomonas sp.]|uniref:hypothetical protein n=1 Tax=Sphingomonas sp. TaxID=28214 RepID=UPI001833EBA6|nr:hypothetical protein [Sphingomonas sp.]MBA3667498.1 hypothetical protein [Sphingomonas sp.]